MGPTILVAGDALDRKKAWHVDDLGIAAINLIVFAVSIGVSKTVLI